MATFAKIKMMSEDVNSLLLTGKFKANGQLARVEDGAIVVVGDLMDSTVYANNKDMNVFEIKAPASRELISIHYFFLPFITLYLYFFIIVLMIIF